MQEQVNCKEMHMSNKIPFELKEHNVSQRNFWNQLNVSNLSQEVRPSGEFDSRNDSQPT